MRLTIRANVSRALVSVRSNAADLGYRGRFNYISSFRNYTQAYRVSGLGWSGSLGRLFGSHVKHYTWWAGSSYASASRVRRFLLASLKRISSATSTIEAAWVASGSRVFIFNNGQNSRMGNGCGSFHSSSRQVVGGSLLASVSTASAFIIKNISNYIRASWGSSVVGSEYRHGRPQIHPSLEAGSITANTFALKLKQNFSRKRSIWSLLRRRSVRRLAVSLYGSRSSYSPSSHTWRWSRSAFVSRRVFRSGGVICRIFPRM